ncbi:tetratricopeptide repeat protein [Actinomadura kijaniata]|uniref:tetratricopeptide repeat protein n=1 Tax=Actinomadura kijaniata TaxID=46161 RepID=UPI00082D8837|nr:tetratricopeptide repeat protein [Actinomadura kijaniata]
MIDHDVRPGSFWERLTPADRQALRAMGRRTDVPPGGFLCHQGVAASGVCVVFRAGTRTVGNALAKEFVDSSEGDESIIDLFGPGDLVGALAPWGHPQRASVRSLDHVAVLRIDRRQFGSLLAANPQVAEAMMHTVAESGTLGGRRHAVRVAEHQQRLAYHLLELAHRFGDAAAHGVEIPLRLSQADLANWAGISRETLVRWFRRWRARGILDGRTRPLTILDPEALRLAASPWGDEWPAAGRPDPAVPDRVPRAGLAARSPVRLEPAGTPATTPAVVRLPADKPFFTGRNVSLNKLDLLVVQTEMPRAVVIQGMAGVGKTTLALHWAHRAADRFPGGVVFADLRGTRGPVAPAEAMGQVLRGVGVPGDQLPRTEAELAAQCRSLLADRRMLLILDDVADAAQVRPLLAALNAGLAIVTTQRRLPIPLDDADIRVLELAEMALDEAVALVAAVLGPGDPRVRRERKAVERLAKECGFLPLALAVMAGKLAEDPAAPIGDTVRELETSDIPPATSYAATSYTVPFAPVPFGRSPDRTAPADPALNGTPLTVPLTAAALPEGGTPATATPALHTALSPTFEVAYRGLRPDRRAAFRALGLATGPDFTAAALAALTGRDAAGARECLEDLRQAFLVQDVSPGRYRMHDLLRDFARERGLIQDADNDRLAAQRRLLAHYLAEARRARRALARHRRPTLDDADAGTAADRAAQGRHAALEWFETERRNLVAAAHQAGRLGLHRTCWELADALFDFQEFRRYTEDNIGIHLAGLRAARAEGDWQAAAVMLHNLAVSYAGLGGNVQAIGYAEEARRGFRSVDPPDRFGEAVALATLADVHVALSRYVTAIEHARLSLEAHRELGDVAGIARGHETLARAYLSLADYPAAQHHADQALTLRRQADDAPGVAESLLTLAQVHRRRGTLHDAARHGLEALFIRQGEGDRPGTAQAMTELARINANLGLRDLALHDARQALRIYQELGGRGGEAGTLTTLGRLMCDAARFAEAFTYCGQALRLHREIGDRHKEAETLAQIGIVHWRLGRYREAHEHLVRALEIRREIGDQHGEAHDLEHLSMVMRRLERHQEAFVLGLEALDLWHRLGARGRLAGTLGSLARTYLRLGLHEEAERAARQALRLREEINDSYGKGIGTDTFATVLRRSGRPVEALEWEHEALRLLDEVGDRYGAGTALVHLAAIHLDLDDPEAALATGRRALEQTTELGDTYEQANALSSMARACQRLGRHDEAVRHSRHEIDIRRDMGDHRGQRLALNRLRASHLARGEHAEAADCVRHIRAIDQWLESAGDPRR